MVIFFFFKVRFLRKIKYKSINWTPTGYASHLSSGDKGFWSFKKGRSSLVFLKAPFSFLIHILNWKDCRVDPIGFAPLFPSGDKLNLLSEWMVGWVGDDQKCPPNFSNARIVISKMCLFQIRPQQLSTAVWSKVISKLNLKFEQISAAKTAKKVMATKYLSSRCKFRKVFKKKLKTFLNFRIEKRSFMNIIIFTCFPPGKSDLKIQNFKFNLLITFYLMAVDNF